MKRLLLKTNEEKKLARKLVRHIMQEMVFLESFPKDRKRKEYFEGYMFGFKEAIVYLTYVLNDKDFTEEIKYLVDWEKDRNKFVGPKIVRGIKKREELLGH